MTDQIDKPDPIVMQFIADRPTKNTHLYRELVDPGEDPHLVNIYVRKDSLKDLADTNKPITAQFVAERETKNTVLFKEYAVLGQDPHFVNVYVRKSTLKKMDHPERIRLTLETDGDGDTPNLKGTLEVDDFDDFPRGRPKG